MKRRLGVTTLAAGAAAAAAVGAVWLWRHWYQQNSSGEQRLFVVGWNGFGQLCTGNVDYHSVPVDIAFPHKESPLVDVGAGGLHYSGFTVFVMENGHVWVCGSNSRGQLGVGDVAPRVAPARALIASTRRVTSVACGTQHCVFVCADGLPPLATGDNTFRQLGCETSAPFVSTPVEMERAGGAARFASCGDSHTALLMCDGSLRLFGGNAFGQLGTSREVTESVMFDSRTDQVIGVACGHSHTLVLLKPRDAKGSSVLSFGSNSHGQLGYATASHFAAFPNQVALPGSAPPVFVSAGARHSLALLEDGSVWAWGSDEYAQLVRKTFLT